MKQKVRIELPIILFETSEEWVCWLDEFHHTSSGIWMRLARKGSEIRSISYAEALEEALRYGWIDGQKNRHDEMSWLQKFTPRGPKSIWSKINREKALRLIEEGRMMPAGLAAVESARKDGRWDAAYDSQSRAEVPADFLEDLEKSPNALAFFATLNSANRYAILFRINTAKKPETRAGRIRRFVEMLEKGEKLYP